MNRTAGRTQRIFTLEVEHYYSQHPFGTPITSVEFCLHGFSIGRG
jgi:hypothetical protein